MRKKLVVALVTVVLALTIAGPALADKTVPPVPPIRPGTPLALQLRSLQVTATVADGVARVRMDQLFVNQTPVPAEGTYLFPIPTGATVSSFQMFVDGEAYSAEVLNATQAREIYESIVRRNRDPALLQFVGQGLLQARVFPVPPGEERKIRVEYDQVLPRDAGLWELNLPLGQDKVPQAAVTVDLKGVGAGSVYSPTHNVAVTRRSDGSAGVSFEGKDVDGSFRLFFGNDSAKLDVSLLSYRSRSEDGYFLLLVNPPAQAQTETVAKDVILVLDLSGSMMGQKFEQAKAAALHLLGSLDAKDRFAFVGFHSDVVPYDDALLSASKAGDAMEYVRNLQLGGATNIGEAMARAQAIAGKESGRPQVIILITDGQPTVGETNADRIVEAVRGRVTASQRIFTFGVGYDVNTKLLDAMAQENRGRSDYVKPGENLESAVSQFWRKVGQPVLSDVTVEWSGVQVQEVYPRPLPDLYLGSQMIVMGRYRTGGEVTITLRGKVNGVEKTYRFTDLSLTADATARDYIPRLWANRKVAYLLAEIKKNGSNKELIDEVVALSQRFGIVTPYTSFFVNEPGVPIPRGPATTTPTSPPGAMKRDAGAAKPEAKAVEDAVAAAPSTGQAAVQQSEQLAQMRDASALSQTAGSDQVRTAADKTFVLRDGIWTDTAYAGGDLIHFKLGSDKYLELVRVRPDLARYLAAGSPLILVDGDKAYGIDIPGHDESDVDVEATLSTTNLPAPNAEGRPLLMGGVLAGLAATGGLTALWLRRRRMAG